MAGEGLRKASVKTAASSRSNKEIKVGDIKPVDLRDWDGDTLYVRNNTNEIISWDDFKGNVMTLRGNNTDEYISVLPIEIARNPGTQRLWRSGKITVSTDPDIEDELLAAEIAETAKQDADKEKNFKFDYVPVGSGEIYSGKAETFEATVPGYSGNK